MTQPERRNPRKGGRPKSEDPRDITISGMLNRAEFASVMEKINASNMRRSEAVRLLLLNAKLPEKIYGGVDVSASAAYVNLQPLQSNLNQIAHWLNKTQAANVTAETLKKINQNVVATYKLVRELRQQILTTGAQTS